MTFRQSGPKPSLAGPWGHHYAIGFVLRLCYLEFMSSGGEVETMPAANILFGILNLSCGLIFILISIPLVKNKVPMNRFYGFRFRTSFQSDEHWYAINRYGGGQLIRWSVLLLAIGMLYFVFPISEPDEVLSAMLGVTPILICTAAAVSKTYIFAKRL